MDEQAQAACPGCGSAASVRSLQQMLDEADRRKAEAIRAREQRPPPSQQPSYRPSCYGIGGVGTNADLGQSVFNTLLDVSGHLLRKTVGARMKRYYGERLKPGADSASDTYHDQLLRLADRYPDLRICTRDQVIFVAGGNCTAPLARLPRPRSADPDAEMSALVAELRVR